MTRKQFKCGALAVTAGATVFHSLNCSFGPVAQWLGYALQYVAPYAAGEFFLDNDSVFDLFQDDFGSGTTFDDRFVPGATRVEPEGAVDGTFNTGA